LLAKSGIQNCLTALCFAYKHIIRAMIAKLGLLFSLWRVVRMGPAVNLAKLSVRFPGMAARVSGALTFSAKSINR